MHINCNYVKISYSFKLYLIKLDNYRVYIIFVFLLVLWPTFESITTIIFSISMFNSLFHWNDSKFWFNNHLASSHKKSASVSFYVLKYVSTKICRQKHGIFKNMVEAVKYKDIFFLLYHQALIWYIYTVDKAMFNKYHMETPFYI